MNKGITVNELLKACISQVSKGNGDKYVLVSCDEEGNEYTPLYYLFNDSPDDLQYVITLERDGNHTADEIVALG